MSNKSTRVTMDDLVNSITSPKGKPEDTNEGLPETVRYDANGLDDSKSKKKFTDAQTCAIQSKAGRNVIYRIKSGRGGRFFNPLKAGLTYGLTVRSNTSNDAMFTLREVNKIAFDNYVKFLKTRYDSYLIAAERE